MGKVSLEDRHLIKALRTVKHWGATKMMQFFPNKPWKLRTLNNIITKVDATGNAPSHRSAQTVAFLGAEGVDFIEPSMWPPNSPDLNPVDYAIWGALEECTYKHKPRNIEELKKSIKQEWQLLSQGLISRSIDQWRKRLHCVVGNQGAHIEHLF
jgi:hypothetical protein